MMHLNPPPMSSYYRDTLLSAIASADHLAWCHTGEFGGDPTPNLQPHDALLLQLVRQFLHVARKRLGDVSASSGRPQARCVPPSPDETERDQRAWQQQQRLEAERQQRVAEADAETERRRRAQETENAWARDEASRPRPSPGTDPTQPEVAPPTPPRRRPGAGP